MPSFWLTLPSFTKYLVLFQKGYKAVYGGIESRTGHYILKMRRKKKKDVDIKWSHEWECFKMHTTKTYIKLIIYNVCVAIPFFFAHSRPCNIIIMFTELLHDLKQHPLRSSTD